jgi:RNA polymerase sigma factor (sigma-70 family)
MRNASTAIPLQYRRGGCVFAGVDRRRAQLDGFFAGRWRSLSGWVRRHLEDEPGRTGEDLVGEVYARLFSRPDEDLPGVNLVGYVYASLRHGIVDRLRARKPMVSLDAPLGREEEGMTLSDVLACPDDTPLDACLRRERIEALKAALADLDAPSRDLILATEFEDRTFRELSEEWQVPIGTLLSRKSRALRRLAVALAEHRN